MDCREMKINEHKIKHLEFIQDIIERMIKNSFVLKGWSLTVLFALMTLVNGHAESKMIFYAVVLAFYFIDSYYLYQQELFIDLYNYVRKKDETDFSLKVNYTAKALKATLRSFPNLSFYLFLLLVVFFFKF